MFYFDYDEEQSARRHNSSSIIYGQQDSSADELDDLSSEYSVDLDAYSRHDSIRMEATTTTEEFIVPIHDFTHSNQSHNMTTASTTTAPTSTVESMATSAGNRSQLTAQLSSTQQQPNQQPRKPRVSKADFILHRVIGKGAYAKVFLVQKSTAPDQGTYYAMKVLRKAHIIIHQKDREHTRTERVILEEVRHPFIVRLFYAFQTDEKLYLILDYAPGGELFTYLDRQKMFLEDTAKVYMCELVLALEHLHSLGIIYRDMKPENVLLDAQGHIKLTDFGLSKVGVGDEGRTQTVCGTVEYMAPEVLAHQSYDYSVDWWSLGAMSFDMLTGRPPFTSNNRKKTIDMIMNKKLVLPKFLTADARDLLTKLMKKRPEVRLGSKTGAEELKKHAFFRRIDWKKVLERGYDAPIQPEIRAPDDVANFHEDFTSMPVVDSPVTDSVLVSKPTRTAGSGTRRSSTQHLQISSFAATKQPSQPQPLNSSSASDASSPSIHRKRPSQGPGTTNGMMVPGSDAAAIDDEFRGFSFVASCVLDEHGFENRYLMHRRGGNTNNNSNPPSSMNANTD